MKHSSSSQQTRLTEGTFRFRTREDIERTSQLVANACPDAERVIVGLSELMWNAVEHGNLGIGHEEKSKINARGTWLEEIDRRLASPEQADRYATLDFKRRRSGITIRIEDMGDGFDWKPYFEIDNAQATDTRSRGIAVARMLSFDSVVYSGKGNVVTVTIRSA